MQWIMSLFRKQRNRSTFGRKRTILMSVLAMAIGGTAIGVTRGIGGRIFQQMLRPFRNKVRG